MSYVGKTCPYCKSKITETDDVVICSNCEMPHHKDCWIENQGCTTFGCNGTIQNPGRENQAPINSTIVYCSNCGHPSDITYGGCILCGTPLINNVAGSQSAYSTAPNDNQPTGMSTYTNAQPHINNSNNGQYQNVGYQNNAYTNNQYGNTGYQNGGYQNGPFGNNLNQNNNYSYNGYGGPQNNNYGNGAGFQGNGFQGSSTGYGAFQNNFNGYNGNQNNGNGSYGSQNQGYQNYGFQSNYFQANMYDSNVYKADVANYVQNNAYYYIDKFDKMQGYGSATTWNWCSFFFPAYWFLYRKMYVIGGAILGINFLMSFARPASSFITLIISILSGVYGNSTYMKQMNRELQYTNFMNEENKRAHLNRKGGTNSAVVVIAIILMFIIQLAAIPRGGVYYE